jgi:hypothetical protein
MPGVKPAPHQSLAGPYALNLSGFWANQPSPPFNTGQLSALGLLSFDGKGKVNGRVSFAGADSGGNQIQCFAAVNSSKSTVSLNSDGSGTLHLAYDPAGGCVAGPGAPPAAGSIDLGFILNDAAGKSASVHLLDFTPAGLAIGGQSTASLMLKGELIFR